MVRKGIAIASFIVSLTFLSTLSAFAEENATKGGTEALVAPNLLGMLFGYYGANVELAMARAVIFR
jgi:hypothetical protein